MPCNWSNFEVLSVAMTTTSLVEDVVKGDSGLGDDLGTARSFCSSLLKHVELKFELTIFRGTVFSYFACNI